MQHKKRLWIIIPVCLLVVAVVILIVVNSGQKETNNLSIEERIARTNPTDYELSDDIDASLREYLLEHSERPDEVLDFFRGVVEKEFNNNNTDEGCRILWREHDILIENNLGEMALEVLLQVDDSKLENYQKDYLYRAIVTASVNVGNIEKEAEYTQKVLDLEQK